MIEFKNIGVYNMENAIRGMRNPLSSWDKADSGYYAAGSEFEIGGKDLKLAQRLLSGGTDDSKFMRQIFVSIDITAPLYWWKEDDQYKVATTTNSESTMHTLSKFPITRDNFSIDNEFDTEQEKAEFETYIQSDIIDVLERFRQLYNKTGDKRYWLALVQLMPNSWNQMRTWTANYQVLRNIYFARKDHKLQEWRDFCKLIEELPYGKELICYKKEK